MIDRARAWLEEMASAEPSNASVRVELSRMRAAAGDLERAATLAAEAMRLDPDSHAAAEQFAAVLAEAGDGRRLEPFAEAFAARFPQSDDAALYRARASLLNGDPARALDQARRLTEKRPDEVRAQNLLGVACATSGDRVCAAAAFEAAKRAAPRDAETYINLGVLRLQEGNPTAAAEHFAVATTLDRGSVAARKGLAEARAAGSSR